MNYVELHIGDYEKATAHLTACEDGIYGRLLRRYYDAEGPLPIDVKALQRLVRARSREEKEAVETVLGEFFIKADDGWRHKRCDEEIARYQDKQRKAKASANARWSKSERNANAPQDKVGETDANALRTHCEGNAHQTPDTRHQTKATTPETSTLAHGSSPAHTPERAREEAPPPKVEPAPQPTEAGRACLLMRQAGCAVGTNPSHPDLLAALAEGVTPEDLAATVREAIEGGKGRPFNWAITTARSRRAQGAKPITAGTASHAHLSLADRAAAKHAARRPEPETRASLTVIEGSASRVPR